MQREHDVLLALAAAAVTAAAAAGNENDACGGGGGEGFGVDGGVGRGWSGAPSNSNPVALTTCFILRIPGWGEVGGGGGQKSAVQRGEMR